MSNDKAEAAAYDPETDGAEAVYLESDYDPTTEPATSAPRTPENAAMLQETIPPKAGEVASVGVPDGTSSTGARQSLAILQVTQVRRPWRSTIRTAFQALVALAVLFPVLVESTGLKAEDAPWLVIPLAVAAAVARLMALPQVEDFLRQFLPFLAAAPKLADTSSQTTATDAEENDPDTEETPHD